MEDVVTHEDWKNCFAQLGPGLVLFARQFVRTSADAEDIVQDTFFHFLKGLPAFRQDASVETYLFTILRRKLVDHFRGRHMRLCSLQDVLDSGGGAAGVGGLLEPPPRKGQQAALVAPHEGGPPLAVAAADLLEEVLVAFGEFGHGIKG